MTRKTLEKIAMKWIRMGWQEGDTTVVDLLHAPDFVDHDPAGRGSDGEAFRRGIAELYEGFPNFHAEITDMVVDEASSAVAIRWTATGTHRGTFMAFSPTDNEVCFKGIEIIKIKDGKIVERWGEWDGEAVQQQLRAE
ncbi:MAG: ester cyclase [Myxococcota bacterium]|nr:ester cyclase [Myxococcota bacterium]